MRERKRDRDEDHKWQRQSQQQRRRSEKKLPEELKMLIMLIVNIHNIIISVIVTVRELTT